MINGCHLSDLPFFVMIVAIYAAFGNHVEWVNFILILQKLFDCVGLHLAATYKEII